jgi:outer membrane protein TolC
MHKVRTGFLALLLIAAAAVGQAQTSETQSNATLQSGKESYSNLLTARVRADKLSANEHWKQYVVDGKLRLSLREAIVLTLENNSDIQVEETAIETQKFNVLSNHQIFDPLLQSNLNINRSSSPTFSQLQSGTSVSNALSQTGQLSYTQLFSPGTTFIATLNSAKSSNNSSYDLFNPYYNSSFNMQFTQPLLRNAGKFATTASLTIARRSLQQSKANFEAQINNTIQQVIQQYWNVINARGTLDVQRKSLKLAEVSFARDKRSLELGALPPLDIYQSQSEEAARKVQVIQAEYSLQQAEESLRYTLGADQDAQWSGLEVELTEAPQPPGELLNIDLSQALAEALQNRPEIESVHDALINDETGIRLAKNQLRPNLSFTGFYEGNGIGGDQRDTNTGKVIAAGGFNASMNQTFGFGFPGYGGALTLNLPLRNSAAKASLGNALVSRTQEMYVNRRTRESITREVKNAVHELEEAKSALTAGATSYDLAQKTLAANQRKYELGTEDNFFVLDAQNKMALAELSLLQAQINYQFALADVGHATGDLLTPYQMQIRDLQR